MSDNDVFTQTEGETESVFEALVGEDKKFKTPEDLARGKQESDAFISKIQDENAGLKEELEKLQAKLGEKESTTNVVEELRNAIKGAESTGNQPADKEALEKLVREIMQGEVSKATAEENRSKGQSLVLEQVGGDVDAARKLLTERANSINMSVADLRELSEKSPEAFAKLIKDEPSAAGNASVTSVKGANTQMQGSSNRPEHIDGVPTKAYFDRIRAEIGTKRFMGDTKLQREYLDAAIKLGPDRFNV